MSDDSEKDSMKAFDVDPPPYNSDAMAGDDVELPVISTDKRASVAASSQRPYCWLLMLAVACFAAVLLTMVAYNGITSRHHRHDPDTISMEMTLKDTDGVEGRQHILSSIVNNYVTYHVTKSSQHMWILDDFEHGVHIMKVVTPDDGVCYVMPLNRSHATSPHVYAARYTNKSTVGQRRGRSQTVLVAAELPVTDRAFLGDRGTQLCRDVPVFSAYRPDDKRQHHHSRSRRNIKKCVLSCCHLVCCCNQKYLHWQSDHYFHCDHVCHGCTPASNTRIDRKC